MRDGGRDYVRCSELHGLKRDDSHTLSNYSLAHKVTNSLTRSLTHSFILLLTRSLARSLSRLLGTLLVHSSLSLFCVITDREQRWAREPDMLNVEREEAAWTFVFRLIWTCEKGKKKNKKNCILLKEETGAAMLTLSRLTQHTAALPQWFPW